MPENNALTSQYKKTKSGLTPEQEKMIGLDKPLTPEEKALAERNRAKIAQLKKEEEEPSLMEKIKKSDWYQWNFVERPKR